jgi:hypothetical protein
MVVQPLSFQRKAWEISKVIADWFIKENFSYVRVFRCSIPPHALPKFLPDRLVSREVAYQIVIGGIDKELKAVSEQVLATFS